MSQETQDRVSVAIYLIFFSQVDLKMLRLTLTATAALSASALGNQDITFDDYITLHHKIYTDDVEYASRQLHFKETQANVIKQNAAYTAGLSTWWAEINEYADRNPTELSMKKIKQPIPFDKHHKLNVATPFTENKTNTNPSSKTWIENQSPVKNQGMCGSCWAFATTEVVESYLSIAENGTKPEVLAPQTLVSCMKNPQSCGGTGGCEGAIAELGFNYTQHYGLALLSDFPYTAKDTKCLKYSEAVTCSGFVKNKQNDVNALETAIATQGPVAITVSANWATYGGGIFSDGCANIEGYSCSLDHAVVAVGYTKDYWLVRNSWGAAWGEAGYIRLTRKYDNTTFTDKQPKSGVACKPYPSVQYPMGESGILFDTSYPTGVKRG